MGETLDREEFDRQVSLLRDDERRSVERALKQGRPATDMTTAWMAVAGAKIRQREVLRELMLQIGAAMTAFVGAVVITRDLLTWLIVLAIVAPVVLLVNWWPVVWSRLRRAEQLNRQFVETGQRPTWSRRPVAEIYAQWLKALLLAISIFALLGLVLQAIVELPDRHWLYIVVVIAFTVVLRLLVINSRHEP